MPKQLQSFSFLHGFVGKKRGRETALKKLVAQVSRDISISRPVLKLVNLFPRDQIPIYLYSSRITVLKSTSGISSLMFVLIFKRRLPRPLHYYVNFRKNPEGRFGCHQIQNNDRFSSFFQGGNIRNCLETSQKV